jgi:hypothetical protein
LHALEVDWFLDLVKGRLGYAVAVRCGFVVVARRFRQRDLRLEP